MQFLVNLIISLIMLNVKKRVAGIEPALLAWKARVLPLNYTRLFLFRIIYQKLVILATSIVFCVNSIIFFLKLHLEILLDLMPCLQFLLRLRVGQLGSMGFLVCL